MTDDSEADEADEGFEKDLDDATVDAVDLLLDDDLISFTLVARTSMDGNRESFDIVGAHPSPDHGGSRPARRTTEDVFRYDRLIHPAYAMLAVGRAQGLDLDETIEVVETTLRQCEKELDFFED